MKTALQHLAELDLETRRKAHPTVPYMKPRTFTDKTANGLTESIKRWIDLNGYFVTRQDSTGIYRADLNKFIPSTQRAGMPDVQAVVNGRAVQIEIKIGKDRLSAVQKETITALEQAGALVYVARTFQGFYDWFNAQVLPQTSAQFNESDELPFGPVRR